jgi:hypothetical protein
MEGDPLSGFSLSIVGEAEERRGNAGKCERHDTAKTQCHWCGRYFCLYCRVNANGHPQKCGACWRGE